MLHWRDRALMTDEEFMRITSYMKQNYGIELAEKREIVRGRLENYIKSGGWKSFQDFMNEVERDHSGVQETMLVNLLTTNYTYFMREFEHFEFFRNVVLPWIKQKESRTKDMRIWCGAASTGEEPYMIAMVIADFLGIEREQWDSTLLATDVSTRALQQAVAGVYTDEHLKSVPEQWKKHFFQSTAGGAQYRVKDELKKQVLFRQFNLMHPFPFKRKMHTVFLRNVMIYFNEQTKRELIQKVYNFMEPGGYLFIGMTETLNRNTTPFEIVKPSIYRKKEGKD
ncbi:MAG TPA: chemotaxis protein CheR [Lachnospiraceae bacterium]|nr:chemotaxis protein CheR [Lachnospiraceae bacterium]